MTQPNLVHRIDRAAAQRGKLYPVPVSSALSSPAPGPTTPVEAEECDWTIFFQVQQPLPYQFIAGGTLVGKQGFIVAIINVGVGQTTEQKFILLSHTAPRRITVHGRYVEVSFYNSVSYAVGSTLAVRASVMKGSYSGPDKYAWTVAQTPIDGAQSGMIWQGSGQQASAVLGWLHVIMQVAPTGPGGTLWYLVGCDVAAASQVVSGTTPVIAGFLSDPLTAAGNTDVLSDDQAPGAIGWSYGLFVGISTTTTVYTSPGAGAAGGQVHVDLKVGQ